MFFILLILYIRLGIFRFEFVEKNGLNEYINTEIDLKMRSLRSNNVVSGLCKKSVL